MTDNLKISRDELKFFGEEPVLKEDVTELDVLIAYNWYNYICTNDEAKQFVIDYLESKNAKKIIRLVEQIDPLKLRTIGWNLRIKLRGGFLPQKTEDKTFDNLYKLTKEQEEISKKKVVIDPTRPVVSVQDRINSKVSEIIGDFEAVLDEFVLKDEVDFDPAAYMRVNDVKPLIARRISSYYESLHSEIKDAIAGKDTDLKQAYSHWTKPKLKKFLVLIESFIAAGNESKGRPKRKEKKSKKKKR